MIPWFNGYPYTDSHELNLDWIIKTVKKTEKTVDDFTVFNKLTWCGVWDASKSYVQWSIVQDSDGNGYIAIKPVPSNVPLTDTDYWQLIAKYSDLYAAFDSRITDLETASISLDGRVDDLETNTTNMNIELTKLINSKFVCSVKEYGATGDGITDDTAAFNDALSSNYKYILIPDGTYKLTDTIVINRQVIIFGSGTLYDDRTLVSDTLNGIINVTADDVIIDGITIKGYSSSLITCSEIFVTDVNNCTINNVTIYDCKQNRNACIEFNHSNNCKCTKCTISDFYHSGIQIMNDCTNITIENNIINTTGGTDINTYGIAISQHSPYPAVDSYINSNINILNNTVSVPAWEGIDAHTGDGIKIIGNYVESPYRGIMLSATEDKNMYIKNCIISNNIINGTAPSIASSDFGIIAASDTIVSNNTIYTMNTGIYIRTPDISTYPKTLNTCNIYGNTIHDSLTGILDGQRSSANIHNNVITVCNIGIDFSRDWSNYGNNTTHCLVQSNAFESCGVGIKDATVPQSNYGNTYFFVECKDNKYCNTPISLLVNVLGDYINHSNLPNVGRSGDIRPITSPIVGTQMLAVCTVSSTANTNATWVLMS